MKNRLLGILVVLAFHSFSQTPTVGLLSHTTGSSDNGYVLFAPMMNDTTYLIDKCGNEVHRWISNYRPGLSVYLLADGTLLRTGNIQSSNFSTGGKGGVIERLDWNSNVVWSYTISTTTTLQHHDVCMLPNGNILAIVWVKKNNAAMVAAGANPSNIGANVLSEQILELQPVGTNSANIVWTWNWWDHLVQDYDNAKANYGVVDQNPQLYNINYGMSANPDWIHLNSIDYNPALDQIIINARNTNEFYVIDHSTTTAEAASHAGGTYGKGGDFLYRWGNPAAYNKGTTADQKFFGQHNAQWIHDPVYHTNDILVFNDGLGRTGGVNYSSVEFLTPPCTSGVYDQTLPYLPVSQNWIYTDTPTTNFFASFTSGAQQLVNGHVLICNGPAGEFFEVDTAKNKVWDYKNPAGMVITTQGNTPVQTNVFRCTFYDSTYSGLAGKPLSFKGPIEKNPLPNSCFLNAIEERGAPLFLLYPNPTSGEINIQTENKNYNFALFDMQGRQIYSDRNNTKCYLDKLDAGLYTAKITTAEGKSVTRKISLIK